MKSPNIPIPEREATTVTWAADQDPIKNLVLWLVNEVEKSCGRTNLTLASPLVENATTRILERIQAAQNATEKKNAIDHSIDVQYAPDLLTAFNRFIEKWCGNYSGHLIDTDDNDGQYIRDRIEHISASLATPQDNQSQRGDGNAS